MPAEVFGDILPELKGGITKKFCIGLAVEREFWNKERAVMDIDRGPCKYI